MLARIGLPGNSYHQWTRGLTKAQAAAWCELALLRRYPNGAYPIDAEVSTLTESEANKCHYLDGSKCYPKP